MIEYCKGITGEDLRHVMMIFSPGESATVVAIRSAKPDAFLVGVSRQLKEAAKQFSGKRPGVICAQFRNLTSPHLRDVAASPTQTGKPTGIQLVTAEFFNSDNRAHVHTVAYTAPGELVRRQYQVGPERITEVQENTASYVFTNRRHPEAGNPEYRVFGRSVGCG